MLSASEATAHIEPAFPTSPGPASGRHRRHCASRRIPGCSPGRGLSAAGQQPPLPQWRRSRTRPFHGAPQEQPMRQPEARTPGARGHRRLKRELSLRTECRRRAPGHALDRSEPGTDPAPPPAGGRVGVGRPPRCERPPSGNEGGRPRHTARRVPPGGAPGRRSAMAADLRAIGHYARAGPRAACREAPRAP